jgi:hypothetical protein
MSCAVAFVADGQLEGGWTAGPLRSSSISISRLSI